MASYKKLKPIILKWEGGYAGNIDGMTCTMRGVTLATFRKYFGKTKNCKDLRNISDSQWDSIFIQRFWNRWSADAIKCQSIANLLVDWVWTSGVYGIKYPQKVLGITADGIVGPKTIAAINSYPNQKELFQKLWNRRKKYFESIATSNKKKFLNGWLNRLNDFKWID
jgi:lysozyme family protein